MVERFYFVTRIIQLKPTAQHYLLEKGHIALNPGETFFEGGTDFARLNFATEAELRVTHRLATSGAIAIIGVWTDPS